jgi:hypothetical protein
MAQTLDNKFKQLVMIAGAMIYGIVMLCGTFFYMLSKPQPASTYPVSPVFMLLGYIIPLIGLGASFVVKQKMLERKDSVIKLREEEKVAVLINTFFVTMAILEGGVLFGFVAAFTTKNILSLLMPALCAAIGFYAHFPKKDKWEHWIQEN